ncbi:MAG: ABC transporter ATP-binding protein [Methanosarcinales archaeon]|nr:ABC transporter ATP-binding protein [Methanosarcinales archaeon]
MVIGKWSEGSGLRDSPPGSAAVEGCCFEDSALAKDDDGGRAFDGRYAVVAEGLQKSFGQLRVLKDLSVSIPRGTTYCLLGPNGSGKTTLIRAIVGLIRLDGGRMQVLGQPVGQVGRLYPRIGYMTQHRALYPDLTLQENMEFFAGLYGVMGQRRADRISDLLEMVELTEHRDRLAGDLSGGMYQRLSLACTLIHEPELLLLDEPTVGIDPLLRQAFWEYFDGLAAGGVTIIITTHLMDEAERCQVVGFMRGGSMLAESSPEALKRLAGLFTTLRLWTGDLEGDRARLESRGYEVRVGAGPALEVVLQSHDQIKAVLDQVQPLDVRLVEPSLDQAFLKLAEVR